MKKSVDGKKGINITETEKKIKIAGWILVYSNLAAVLIGGKIKLFLLAAILLATYAMYLRFYPYMYFDTISKKSAGTGISTSIYRSRNRLSLMFVQPESL